MTNSMHADTAEVHSYTKRFQGGQGEGKHTRCNPEGRLTDVKLKGESILTRGEKNEDKKHNRKKDSNGYDLPSVVKNEHKRKRDTSPLVKTKIMLTKATHQSADI